MTFSELHTPKARLIRCTEPPEIGTLNPNDMVICEEGWGVSEFVAQCREKGVHVRTGRFRYETEKVVHRRTRSGVQADYPEVLLDAAHIGPPGEFATSDVVEASTAAFAVTWDALTAQITQVEYEDASEHIPEDLAACLPYPTVNPAQAQAAPYIMGDRPVMVVAPTGAGKLLTLDTRIPTPTGWTTMGDLEPGDEVLDEAGKPCRVLAVSPVDPSPELCEVVFSDGSTIHACVDHQWWTEDRRARVARVEARRPWKREPRVTESVMERLHREFEKAEAGDAITQREIAVLLELPPAGRTWARTAVTKAARRIGQRGKSFLFDRRSALGVVIEAAKAPKHHLGAVQYQGEVRTTSQIKDSLVTESGHVNHSIPVARPLDLPEADLPVPPYTLGLWLGDGNARNSQVTGVDSEVMQYVGEEGFDFRIVPSSADENNEDYHSWCILGLRPLLRSLGLAQEDSQFRKFIPTRYLRASIGQRRALLAGLLDSDGTSAANGRVEFDSTRETLALGAHELALSLGYRATIVARRAVLDGRDCGPSWRVSFTAEASPFRLSRKTASFEARNRYSEARSGHRYITDVRPIPSRPGKCITVDSPNSLYLAGEAMIPTHNTVIGMMAASREIKHKGRKAAWLVPQRTLTAELDRDLQKWRDMGIKVVSLSGEATTDAQKTKDADLWVATTEKFEALCRASSMKEAIAEIGTVIVDEIHLLGEPSRGPVLESLLARIRQEDSGTRLVGLSATAANADQVAEWLNADLVEITWRPTRLTNQLLTLPNTDSRAEEDSVRNEAVTSLVRETSERDGSTLVFCGSKHNVRSTALAIAAARGVRGAHSAQPGDIETVAELCASAGIGLHYSDWPHKKEAERQFRERETDVLVATSTLAAGVNTPARVVVVRDTSIGPQPMEVSMIQQMFGRAGRAGKEVEGWSFLLVGANELGRWRQRLGAGYTINSGILDSVADHLLGEVVQGNVRSQDQAERWWESTLAYHQGEQNLTPINEARDFLTRWRFLETEETTDGLMWSATRLGAITSKMMVNVKDAASLLAAVSRAPMPNGAFAAETALFEMLVNGVYSFENAQDAPGGDHARRLREVLLAEGIQSKIGEQTSNNRDKVPGREVVRAGLMLLARSPQAFASQARTIAGVNRALFNPAIYDSPRYLAWLAALGPLGAIPSWVSVVSADLGQRITHHRLRPRRGDGRFLYAATKLSLSGPSVGKLWEEARMVGGQSPARWLKQTTLGGKRASALASAVVTISNEDGVHRASRGASLFAPQSGQPFWARVPAAKGSPSRVVAAFGSQGDWSGTGWLEEFSLSRG